MTTALSELRQELESKHSQIMTIRINQLESTHKALVDGKNDNIRMLESKIQHLKSLHAEELKKMMEQHDIERTKLTGSVRDLEAAVADISARLVSTEKSLEIKTADVEQHLLTIQGLNSTVRTLETDKADLFQKMLHIDEQTRTELEERYEREAVEWKEEWELKLQAALNSLRDELSLQHIKELDILRTKLETEKKEELNVYTQQMQALKDEFEEEARKFRTQIEKLEQEKEDMFKDVLQEQELRKEALEAAYQRFEEDLWRERTKWETEQQARETQLKVASTLALANIEKKHAAQIEELESLHNRQIEDLRNFHTISALAAKKEAETVRQDLIAKTTMQHSEEIQALEDKHARELMELTEQLNIERVNEIASLNDLREAELKAKDDAIAFIEEECRKHEAAEKALLIQVRENSFDIASLKELLSSRDQDIIRIKEETKKLVHQTEAELALTHQAHVERLNEEHIAECQQMLQEFEQAQQFLKKQVMTQAKQLQEADLRYINREPREVDLTRIAELEDDVKRRKRKIAALMEEVEFFKLELNNREANFNRIFNKTPIVGLIEPLKFVGTQKKRDGRPDMSQRLPPLQASVPPAAITNPSSTPPLVAPAASPAPTQKRPRSGAVYPTITAVPLASEL
ncbi:hypothetical protein BJ742DRAFT_104093 [Cladochytrium replicatum]|nr:hypothetical protein BJ742DRAFT_104093 [Cladochytrium replicatum]